MQDNGKDIIQEFLINVKEKELIMLSWLEEESDIGNLETVGEENGVRWAT
jgi:hypothetical protein